MKIKFKYIATQDKISIIPILENIIDIDFSYKIIEILYDGVELEDENYTIDISNKQIQLKDWFLNIGEQVIYKIETINNEIL